MTTTARTIGLHPSTRFPVPDETTAPAPAEHRGVATRRSPPAGGPHPGRHPAPRLPRPARRAPARRPRRGQHQRHDRGRGRRHQQHARRPRGARGHPARGQHLGRRAPYGARRAARDPRRPARRGALARRRDADVAHAVPAAALVPDRRGQPTVASRRRGRPAAHPRPHRPADRLRLPRPSLPAGRLPDGVRHRPRAAPRCRRRRVRSPPTSSPG